MHIYKAQLFGYDFLADKFVEPELALVWPCGKTTNLKNANLFDVGNAIGEHATECEVCDDGRRTSRGRHAAA